MNDISHVIDRINKTLEQIKDSPIEEEYQEIFHLITEFLSDTALQTEKNVKNIYNHALFKQFQKKHPFNKELGNFARISCHILAQNISSRG